MLDKTKKIVLAGGAGFIGKHLARTLHSLGYTNIWILDNFYSSSPEDFAWKDLYATFCEIDIRSKGVKQVLGTNVGAIINLASPASPVIYQKDPEYTFETNVEGTENLVEIAAQHNARYIQCSTSEIYGYLSEGVMEEFYTKGYVNTVGPRSCYDEGKRAAETVCYLHKQKGLDVRIVRIFNTFGPGMNIDDGRIIPEFTKNLLLGECPQVYDGDRVRCYSPVFSTVEAIIKVLEVEEPEDWIYNIGSQVVKKNREILLQIADILNRKDVGWDELPPRQDDPLWRYPSLVNISKLNWRAPTETDFKDCLIQTVNDIKIRINDRREKQ